MKVDARIEMTITEQQLVDAGGDYRAAAQDRLEATGAIVLAVTDRTNLGLWEPIRCSG